jgi:hypothetical protein
MSWLGATNSVLRAINSPGVTSAQFASPDGENNAREIRQAKEILDEVYTELQNDRPDSFWQKSVEFKIFKPYTVGGVSAIGVDPLNVDITFANAFLDDVPWMTAAPQTGIDDTLLHILAERQYYRVTGKPTSESLTLFQGVIEQQGFNDPAFPIAYALFKYRYDLPVDFRDVLNVYNPYVGADLIPVGSERMVELISEYAYLVTTQGADTGWGTDPEYYTIQRDDVTGKKMIIVHPITVQDRVLTLRYQKNRGTLSAAGDTFDLDEDYMPILLSRAKARACIEIVDIPGKAKYYHGVEAEQKKLAKIKAMEGGSQNQRLTPTTGSEYRAHYRETQQEDYNRRLWLRR